ncbi:MAG: Ig-like domain-containing protein [Clostridia bacterium]|nr:Ig-like domain-containing protein [Clostridia bacterium]
MDKKDNNSNKKKIIIGIVVLLVILVVLLLILLRKPQYEVSFDSNGGTIVASIIVDKNGLAIKPEDPTRENYIFAGWYYNDELFDFSTPITGDIKLEARWVEIGRVAGVALDKNVLTLNVGDTVKLNATVTPEDASDKTIAWESSNPDVVSVDADGNIKALKAGKATITVTTNDGEFTAKVEITVNEKAEEAEKVEEEVDDSSKEPVKPEKEPSKEDSENKPNDDSTEEKPNTPSEETIKVNGVSLNKTNLNLYVNESAKLTANIKPNNASNKKVTWVSSNPDVASVDANGNVKALKEGTATITVTTDDGNKKAECTVTVSKKPDNYVVTFTAKPMEGTGSLMQYTVSVTKNGASCNYYRIIYNGRPIDRYPSQKELSNKNGTAQIMLTENGNPVPATSVVFK